MCDNTKVKELQSQHSRQEEDNSLQELQARVNSLLKDRKQFFLVGLKDIDSDRQ